MSRMQLNIHQYDLNAMGQMRGFYRMHLKDEQFANLTKVTLTEKCGHTYSTDNPHRMAKVSPRSILVRQAHSVRYIADHCRFLVSFRIQPYLQGSVTWSARKRRGLRGVAPKSTEALIQAIVYLVETCEHPETICIRYVIEVHETEDCYLDQRLCEDYFSDSCKCREQDYEFLVPERGYVERLEWAEEWTRDHLDWLRMQNPEWEML
ncbi:uncharacterized protein J4E87_002133 [Alternaria ethzedia]|uniref:uncharacterized protein n=1 Tax=Alternaria ethzedia TaxID=181014 RepID=UPI0020C40B38|nr:uncharacterized protein J4E87_002133 [Alternaria ethzedia]KAI4631429.1 hypothetical protein J4E87_002133 [Alternaria ethzedia]